MLYHLVRPVARYVLRFYYRNIDLTGLENIPRDAAVILAANHPTAFIEPCILACFQPRTLWFLARGDLFKSRLARLGLAAVNILPVFRLEDGGYGKLRNNFDTFDACHRALSARRAIMILAEGRCIHEKTLRPLRKGTARLALGAMAKDPTLPEVYIVPVGVNFEDAAGTRGNVMVRCGAPILASAYMDDYRANEATAIKNLTSHLRTRLSPLVVQFPNRELADVGEARLQTDRDQHNTHQRYGITHDGEQLDRELHLAATTTADEAPLRYRARLAQNGLDRRPNLAAHLRPTLDRPRTGLLRSLAAIFFAVLQLPFLSLWACAEFIASALPKTVEFYSPVRFAAVAGGTFVLFPLGLLLLPWPSKIWLVLTLLTVRPAVRSWEALREWKQVRRWAQLVPEERAALGELAGKL